MPRKFYRSAISALILTLLTPCLANAARNCLRDQRPYQLADDMIEWSITLDAGSNCIQSLQTSRNRVYSIAVVESPAKGELVLSGPAFRYFAKSDGYEPDKFTLIVYGRNRQGEGFSTLEITVSPPSTLSPPALAHGHGQNGRSSAWAQLRKSADPRQSETFAKLLGAEWHSFSWGLHLRSHEQDILGLGDRPTLSFGGSSRAMVRFAVKQSRSDT